MPNHEFPRGGGGDRPGRSHLGRGSRRGLPHLRPLPGAPPAAGRFPAHAGGDGQRRPGLRSRLRRAAARAALLGHRRRRADRRAGPGRHLVRLAAGAAVDRPRLHLHRRRPRLFQPGRLGAPRRGLDRRDRAPQPVADRLPPVPGLRLAVPGLRHRRLHRHHRPDLPRRGQQRRGRSAPAWPPPRCSTSWRPWSWASCSTVSAGRRARRP